MRTTSEVNVAIVQARPEPARHPGLRIPASGDVRAVRYNPISIPRPSRSFDGSAGSSCSFPVSPTHRSLRRLLAAMCGLRGPLRPLARPLATATRAEGLRRLADSATDLHCGGIDDDEPLPDFLRRERFLDMTAGVVVSSGHPLLAAKVARRDLSRYLWIDFDWPATASPGDGRPSLDALLEGLGDTVPVRVRTVLRAGTAGRMLTRRPTSSYMHTFSRRCCTDRVSSVNTGFCHDHGYA